jgi:DNA-directed RNA polymerase subunit RPC12/RpoP
MGQVVRLADRLRRAPAAQQTAPPLEAHAYFCMRCDTDRFLLYPGGAVQCANCGAQLDNLEVSEKAP